MNLFDILQMISAVDDCKVGDINPVTGGVETREAFCDAMQDGYVNCIDGKLTLTKEGAAVYRGMRDSRSGG